MSRKMTPDRSGSLLPVNWAELRFDSFLLPDISVVFHSAVAGKRSVPVPPVYNP